MNMIIGWVILVVAVAIGIFGAAYTTRFDDTKDKSVKR